MTEIKELLVEELTVLKNIPPQSKVSAFHCIGNSQAARTKSIM
jgi:hypothetical protein